MKLLSVLLWLPAVAIKLVLVLLGLIVVPVALTTRGMTINASKEERDNHWPDLFWLWGNDEEGCPDWWKKRAAQQWWTRHWPEFWWYAIRNPVNNLRFLFKDVDLSQCYLKTNWQWDIPMEAKQLREAGKGSAFYFIQHSWMSGYRRVWLNPGGRYSEFWIGWKLASGVPGLGFALQLRLKREIGK